jgi:hypothetical protein
MYIRGNGKIQLCIGKINIQSKLYIEMTKNEILNSDYDVRRSAAGNPNTPGYKETTYDFVVTKNYVAIKGTNHMWYKHNYPPNRPFLYLWMFLRFKRTTSR